MSEQHLWELSDDNSTLTLHTTKNLFPYLPQATHIEHTWLHCDYHTTVHPTIEGVETVLFASRYKVSFILGLLFRSCQAREKIMDQIEQLFELDSSKRELVNHAVSITSELNRKIDFSQFDNQRD